MTSVNMARPGKATNSIKGTKLASVNSSRGDSKPYIYNGPKPLKDLKGK